VEIKCFIHNFFYLEENDSKVKRKEIKTKILLKRETINSVSMKQVQMLLHIRM